MSAADLAWAFFVLYVVGLCIAAAVSDFNGGRRE